MDDGGTRWKEMDENGMTFVQGKKKSGSCESLFIQYYIIGYLSLRMVRLPW